MHTRSFLLPNLGHGVILPVWDARYAEYKVRSSAVAGGGFVLLQSALCAPAGVPASKGAPHGGWKRKGP